MLGAAAGLDDRPTTTSKLAPKGYRWAPTFVLPVGSQDSGHGVIICACSGPGFDLVAQGEVGAWVEGVCGGEVLAQLGDGGGGAQGW